MSVEVKLPELGESVVEATVGQWLVKEGDSVELDQPLVEITTDKADAELPAPSAGVVVRILVGDGEVVSVGTTLCRIEEGAQARPPTPASTPVRESAPSSEAPRATPVARRLAQEIGVDLAGVPGTGASGRITREDVRLAENPLEEPQASAAAEPPRRRADPGRPPYAHYDLQPGDRVIPMSPLRRIVAEHMVYSKQTSPHVGTVAEVDLGRVAAVREAHKRQFQQTHGFPLTYLPFVVHALVRALREYPGLNASVVDDAIVEKQAIHVGIAVETDKGLLVPVVRHTDRLSLAGLSAAVEDLSQRARSKKLSADELHGGTFTVTNPGRHGNLFGFAIINQPQVAILRMGEIVKRPVVRTLAGEDAIVVRPIMHLALSYDHRAVDGAPANAFLRRIRELLEEAEFDL
jgi:pyruvate/2-oxoglutarate dehydrogenase complex dihydrolipoamide acyltransferase (E2) component